MPGLWRGACTIQGYAIEKGMSEAQGEIRIRDEWDGIDPSFVERVVQALDGQEPKAVRVLVRDLMRLTGNEESVSLAAVAPATPKRRGPGRPRKLAPTVGASHEQ